MILLELIVRNNSRRGALTLNEPPTTATHTATSGKDTLREMRSLSILDALLDMRFPGDVTISPDGKRVAFVVREMPPGEQKRRGHIWMVEIAGDQPRPFVAGKREEYSPLWSPDGKQLAFIAQEEGDKEKPQVYLMSAEGGTATRLCKMPNGVSDLQWSPDGSCLSSISLESEEPRTDPKVIEPARHRRLRTIGPDHTITEHIRPTVRTGCEYSRS